MAMERSSKAAMRWGGSRQKTLLLRPIATRLPHGAENSLPDHVVTIETASMRAGQIELARLQMTFQTKMTINNKIADVASPITSYVIVVLVPTSRPHPSLHNRLDVLNTPLVKRLKRPDSKDTTNGRAPRAPRKAPNAVSLI